MTNDLTNTFTPHYKDGGIDNRCREDMRQIFQGVSATTLEGLSKFRNEKQRIENEYGRYAFELAMAFSNTSSTLMQPRSGTHLLII